MFRQRLLLTTACCLLAVPAWAQILPTVDVVNTTTTDIRSLAFAADGKLYASGNVEYARPELKTAILRYNADGTLDSSFGNEGMVVLDVAFEAPIPDGRRRQQSFGVAELPNGDVLATVHGLDEQSGQSAYLLRFDSEGNQMVAPEWGDELGRVEVVFGWANADNADYGGDVGPVDSAWNLWVDPSNGDRVVVTGHGPAPKDSGRTDHDRYVVRLNAADGSVDATFNGGQPVNYHSTGTNADNARRSMIEEDGSVVTAGFTNFGDGLGIHAVIVKVSPDGTLDESFGGFVEPSATGIQATPGVAVINPFQADGGMAEAYAVVKLPDGSYVTSGPGEATAEGGTSTLGFEPSAAEDFVSFHIVGNELDSGWGSKGIVAVQSEAANVADAEDNSAGAVALPDGRSVHAGAFGGVPAVYVLTSDGQLDTSVDGDGILELPHDTIGVGFNSAFVSPDGRRVAVTSDVHEAGARIVVLDVQN